MDNDGDFSKNIDTGYKLDFTYICMNQNII